MSPQGFERNRELGGEAACAQSSLKPMAVGGAGI